MQRGRRAAPLAHQAINLGQEGQVLRVGHALRHHHGGHGQASLQQPVGQLWGDQNYHNAVACAGPKARAGSQRLRQCMQWLIRAWSSPKQCPWHTVQYSTGFSSFPSSACALPTASCLNASAARAGRPPGTWPHRNVWQEVLPDRVGADPAEEGDEGGQPVIPAQPRLGCPPAVHKGGRRVAAGGGVKGGGAGWSGSTAASNR